MGCNVCGFIMWQYRCPPIVKFFWLQSALDSEVSRSVITESVRCDGNGPGTTTRQPARCGGAPSAYTVLLPAESIAAVT